MGKMKEHYKDKKERSVIPSPLLFLDETCALKDPVLLLIKTESDVTGQTPTAICLTNCFLHS